MHFVDDQELNPTVYAEQFADPEPTKALSPEELLARARMLLATELGKDPLLRNHVRKLFKDEAQISVEPTERGISKIDEHHPYFVSCVFSALVDLSHADESKQEFQISAPEKYQGHA